jgi:SAM-dependent methyltransferase
MKVKKDALKDHILEERRHAKQLKEASEDERGRLYGVAYDATYASFGTAGRNARDLRFGASLADPMIIDHIFGSGNNVLEVGCGFGWVAMALARTQETVVGVDVSAKAVDQACRESSNLSNVHFAVMEATHHLALPDGSFDAVVGIDFIEHLHPDDVVPHLQEIWRVLRPGGAYYIKTPSRLSGPSDLSRLAKQAGLDDDGGEAHCLHLKEWTYRELTSLLHGQGFHCSAVPLRGAGGFAWPGARASVAFLPLWSKLALERFLGIRSFGRAGRLVAKAFLTCMVVAWKSERDAVDRQQIGRF